MTVRTPVLTRSDEGPRWARIAPYAAGGGALLYGALRTYWALGHRPFLPPMGTDLGVMSGWGIVALCAGAAVIAPLTVRVTAGRTAAAVRALAWAVGAGIVASAVLLVLDVVALVFPGIGIPHNAAALSSRAGCAAVGAALLASALAARRRARAACPYCGRTDRSAAHAGHADEVPRWARIAGYAAVAGCLTRLAAQASVGFGPSGSPLGRESTTAGTAFIVCLVLAGTLLPLALVHHWGRVFPRWVPGLAGRGVPRAVPLVPAWLVAGGLLLYFGISLVELVIQTAAGSPVAGDGLSAGFFWAAVGGYVTWGTGLALAAYAYGARTRRACARCGRG
ncbi:MAG TPA: hypothetical protein VGL93_25680 [Streptosporangiaceae bacterium]|jgi:hypothetical protein